MGNLNWASDTAASAFDYGQCFNRTITPTNPIEHGRLQLLAKELKYCCTTEKEDKQKEEDISMSMLNNTIFGKIAPGLCRLGMSGKIAIKTSNGYKSYDVEKGRLTNCDNFVFDVGEEFFFVMPTNRVKRGDIILVNGKPRCVLEVGVNEIKTFCYEDSTISTIVPERHIFMGKNFFYGKIVSAFGDIEKNGKGMGGMMKYMMLSEIMKNAGGKNDSTALPMMLMIMGGNNATIFDDIFNYNEEEENDD